MSALKISNQSSVKIFVVLYRVYQKEVIELWNYSALAPDAQSPARVSTQFLVFLVSTRVDVTACISTRKRLIFPNY